MNDALRQTGRTTRMLRRAIEAYRLDPTRQVYVMVATKDQVGLVSQYLGDLWEEATGKSRFAQRIFVKSVDPEDRGASFDWKMLRYTTADRRALYFLDHALAGLRVEVLKERIRRANEQIDNLAGFVNA